MNNYSYLLTPVIFLAAWIGFDLLRGRTLEFEKVVVGALLSVIVGLVLYVQQTRKK